MSTDPSAVDRFDILGVRISAIDMGDAVAVVDDAVSSRRKIHICVCPVSTIMSCRRDADVMESVNSASLATPDGMPVVWTGWLRGHKNIKRVYGPELMEAVCGLSSDRGYGVFFYGSSDDVLGKLKERLKARFPAMKVSGYYSPPFCDLTPEEDEKAVCAVNNSRADIVCVGLGSPKQDIWMHRHRNRIDAPVMIGVGAAFDFIAGTKPQAPRWMRSAGLEWLFRLMTEPRRLWRRYLFDNTSFVFHMAVEYFSGKWRSNRC
jgi:N-acetylglucosaminyldiphosphoundecaprenol N-acetyl-beta-D-mannosaminyltransferase